MFKTAKFRLKRRHGCVAFFIAVLKDILIIHVKNELLSCDSCLTVC